MHKIIKTTEDMLLIIKQLKALPFETKANKLISYDFKCVKRTKRSNQENRYMWFVNAFYGEYLGYTAWEMHYDVLAKLRTSIKIGTDGKEREIVKKTSKMNHKEHSNYMENIRTLALKHHDFYIPEPNEVPEGYYEKYNQSFVK